MHARNAFPILVLSVLVPSCGPAPAQDVTSSSVAEALAASDAAWWHGLTQVQRNQAILDRAGRDLGACVGLECKPWVQRVVAEASRGAAVVPLNAPDANGWYWQPNAYAVGMDTDIRNVQPGWIIQMRVRYVSGGFGPHTAIVCFTTADGVWLVDSNWKHDDVVRQHYLSFADFVSLTTENGQSHYAVYYIGG